MPWTFKTHAKKNLFVTFCICVEAKWNTRIILNCPHTYLATLLRPYCDLATTKDAAQSPWTHQGRREVVARTPRTHKVADRRRLFWTCTKQSPKNRGHRENHRTEDIEKTIDGENVMKTRLQSPGPSAREIWKIESKPNEFRKKNAILLVFRSQ